MAIKKAKRLLTVEFLDSDPIERRLSNYLKSTNNAKAKVVTTAQAHLDSIALSEDPSISDEDVELAALDSIQSLWSQMNYIVDYHRIKRKIQLTPESLKRFGLGPIVLESMASPVPSQLSVPTRRSTASVEADENRESASNTIDDDDDDDDDVVVLRNLFAESGLVIED